MRSVSKTKTEHQRDGELIRCYTTWPGEQHASMISSQNLRNSGTPPARWWVQWPVTGSSSQPRAQLAVGGWLMASLLQYI
jgi:hypothetical protein